MVRKKDVSLRDTLLKYARAIVEKDGTEAINIRSIAQMAGVATGTVYNYFANKDEILLVLTEEYWQKALHEMSDAIAADSFSGQLVEIFNYIHDHMDSTAKSLMRSLGHIEAAGQERMTDMQASLQLFILQRMEQDMNVHRDIWDETFTKEKFARFLMMNMLFLLKENTPDISVFIKAIKLAIY